MVWKSWIIEKYFNVKFHDSNNAYGIFIILYKIDKCFSACAFVPNGEIKHYSLRFLQYKDMRQQSRTWNDLSWHTGSLTMLVNPKTHNNLLCDINVEIKDTGTCVFNDMFIIELFCRIICTMLIWYGIAIKLFFVTLKFYFGLDWHVSGYIIYDLHWFIMSSNMKWLS